MDRNKEDSAERHTQRPPRSGEDYRAQEAPPMWAPNAAAPLSIRLFGPFEARLHGQPLHIPCWPVIFGSAGGVGAGELGLGGGRRLSLQQEFEQSMTAAEREQIFPLGLRDPYAIQQLDWLRAIERGVDPETSGREGLRDLACAFTILESSTLGRQVTLREVLDHSVDAYQRDIDEHYDLL